MITICADTQTREANIANFVKRVRRAATNGSFVRSQPNKRTQDRDLKQRKASQTRGLSVYRSLSLKRDELNQCPSY